MTNYVRSPEGAAALTVALKKLLTSLEPLVRDELEDSPEKLAEWEADFAKLKGGERTSESWLEWSDSRITQVASSWVLLTVFARFCEDNELFGARGPVWFAGPLERRQEALELRLRMFSESGSATDQTWLNKMFSYFEAERATQPLVGDGCPAQWLDVGALAASKVVEFWHAKTDAGELLWDFTDEQLETRFLGDLYQDLSEAIQKKYALRQTPVFVEEFILDHTLDPALREFPLADFKMIDPTCGSGHFLLGGFDRIFQAWQAKEPGAVAGDLVQRTLNSVCGVDVNPYAIAITRFRLLVKAMRASGDKNLCDTKAFSFQLVCADALTKIEKDLLSNTEGYIPDPRIAILAPIEKQLAEKLLTPGTYHAVVGNPPYITPKDKALNILYRKDYGSCHGQYAMTVPFMERFFELAVNPDSVPVAGRVGMITGKSLCTAQFGKKLIEKYLPAVDLTHIIDTSGAYIPGHSTPTFIIFGKNQVPVESTLRAMLGIQSEPGRPDAPADGLVWSSIRDHLNDRPDTGRNEIYEDQWISVVDIPRSQLAAHPWSLAGGGAASVSAAVASRAYKTLGSRLDYQPGFGSISGEDNFFLTVPSQASRSSVPLRAVCVGENIRDFVATEDVHGYWPYSDHDILISEDALGRQFKTLSWSARRVLQGRLRFGKPIDECGVEYYEWREVYWQRYKTPLSITFAFVATHNHFVLDRGGKVFKQSAPVIKLPKTATEDDHLELLGVLNSSTACFWLRQNSYQRPGGGSQEKWEHRWQCNGTDMERFPLPETLPLERGRRLDALAQELNRTSPSALAEDETPTTGRLEKARAEYERIRALMIAEQEELDWECYRLYGLIKEDLCYSGAVPELALGERAFEITLARSIDAGTCDSAWFDRHNSTPTSSIPAHLPADYQELIKRRLDATAASKNLRILEAPEHKRRWQTDGWDALQKTALQDWLLTHLENRDYWFDNADRPRPRTINELATEVGNDPEFTEVLNLWNDRRNQPIPATLTKLLTPESVPHAAPLRLKESGMRKRRAWEHTWELQRQEDAGDLPIDPKTGEPVQIPVPPKYGSTDFLKPHWWQHRGKLDVPKERFIAYPGAHPESDTSELLGWAGWDHAQQATALATIMIARNSEGATTDVITPLLVGLQETLPWVDQWHPDTMPELGMTLGAYLGTLLETTAAAHGHTPQNLPDWRPPATTTRRRKKTTS